MIEMQINCHQCRYQFRVEVASSDDWNVQVQCPNCESWVRLTVASQQDLERAHQTIIESEIQQLGAMLWQPINDNHGHPALAWMDRVGNGLFVDDCTATSWPVPHRVYRFTRDSSASYIWQENATWLVRGRLPLNGLVPLPVPIPVLSFAEALDLLMG